MLDGLAYLWSGVHDSADVGPESQDPRNSSRKLSSSASWLRGGEEGMGESGDAELEKIRVLTFP